MAAVVADAGVAVRRHALARAQHPHAVPRRLRRRRPGRVPVELPGGWTTSCAAAASAASRSCSTPGSASPSRPSTTGGCWPTSTGCRRWAARCSSAPPASVPRPCWPDRTACPRPAAAERDDATAATTVIAGARPAPGRCGCTTSRLGRRLTRRGRVVRRHGGGPMSDRISLCGVRARGLPRRPGAREGRGPGLRRRRAAATSTSAGRPAPTTWPARSATPRWPPTSWPSSRAGRST